MRLYSWLELFTARLRHFSRLRRRGGRGTARKARGGSLSLERLEERMLMAAPQPFDLGSLNGISGYTFSGVDVDELAGYSVRNAGDVGGGPIVSSISTLDGFDDFLITAPLADGGPMDTVLNAGATYLVLGGSHLATLDAADGTTDGNIDLSLSLAGHGFRIEGQSPNLYPSVDPTFPDFSMIQATSPGLNQVLTLAMTTATGIGDFNGDGIADIGITQPNATAGTAGNAGRAYFIWGGTSVFRTAINSGVFSLATLDNADTTDTFGGTGIRIHGPQGSTANEIGSAAGYSITRVGDVDGDGYDDVLIGAHRLDRQTGANGNYDHGEAYIVFGKSVGANNDGGWFDDSLVTLGGGGTRDFQVTNTAASQEGFDKLGFAVTGVGDINGDGKYDFAVSAPHAYSSIGDGYTGRVYVVFGNERGSIATTTGSLNGTNGFRIDGAFINDQAGLAIANAGDVNGDGFDDLIIGAPKADPGAKLSAGVAYVVFGRSTWTGMANNVLGLRTDLNGQTGFRIEGQYSYDYAGFSVGGAGDIDGDGFDDVFVGAPGYNGGTGRVYVVFGRKTGFDPFILAKDLAGTDPTITATHIGFAIDGIGDNVNGDGAGWSVASAGDVNGDGFADLMISAPFAYTRYDGTLMTEVYSGQAYIVFGGGNIRVGSGRQVGDGVFMMPNDTLVGVNGATNRDMLIGATGDDILISDGGPDVLYGGQGNDFLHIRDANFFIPTGIATGNPVATRRLDGGLGRDTLVFNSTSTPGGPATPTGLTLNLTTIPNNRIQNIEVIDIRNGANTLIVSANEVRKISNSGYTNGPFAPTGSNDPTGNTLIVRRAIGDTVVDAAGALNIGSGGWMKLYDVVDDVVGSSTYGVTFEVYVAGNELGIAVLMVEDPAVLNVLQLDGYDPADGSTSGTQPNGHQGVNLMGQLPNDQTGFSVSGVGDVDGDGFDDFVVGAPFSDFAGLDTNYGAVFLVYGKAGNWNPTFDLRRDTDVIAGIIDGTNGVLIAGIDPDDAAGVSVTALGDIDGDGYMDFAIGVNRAARDNPPGVDTSEGEAYVIRGRTFFGRTTGNTFDLGTLTTADVNGDMIRDGFILRGNVVNDFAGFAVAGGGDINGDGLADIIVGAFQADQTAGFNTSEGKTYVVFGGNASLGVLDAADMTSDGLIDLHRVNGLTGFRLDGITAGDQTGRALSFGGDFNGDGIGDLLISGHGVDANPAVSTTSDQGATYVVFGKTNWAATPVVSLATINGVTGVKFNGQAVGDFAGWSASYAGDVNGDGFDDIVIGAYRSDANGNDSGRSYVVFGKSNWAATGVAGMNLSTINGTNGFVVAGGGIRMTNNNPTGSVDNAGFAVTGIGDFNGDGFDDIAIGVPRATAHASVTSVSWNFGSDNAQPTGGFGDTGQVYVVFGKANWATSSPFQPDLINGLNGIRIDGNRFSDYAGFSARAAGDVNGDGFDDIIVGGPRVNVTSTFPFPTAPFRYDSDAGVAYLIFGGSYPGTAKPVVGTQGNDPAVNGANGAGVDQLIGRQGNDTVNSNGGDDILYGGQGDDNIVLSDTAFTGPRRVDGGNGVDTLTFGATVSGGTLNLTQLGDNRIQNIERINITGGGNNTLTLSVAEVMNLSSNARGTIGGSTSIVSLSNALTVLRNFGDTVNRGAGWTTATTALLDPGLDQFFERYTATPNTFTGGTATLAIQSTSVVISGNTAIVSGTTGDDVFVYDSLSNVLTVMLAGETTSIAYDLDDVALIGGGTAITNVVVDGFGGNDRVSLLGTNLDDSVNVGNTSSNVLFGNGRTLSAANTETTTLDGRGQTTRDLLTLTGAGQNIDLRSRVLMPDGSNQLTVDTQGNRNLEIIDLSGAGDNALTLDIASVTPLNDTSTTTLTVLRNVGDSVTFADRPNWGLEANAEWDAGRMSFFERYHQAGELVRVQGSAVTVSGGVATVTGTNLDNIITYDATANDVTLDGVVYDLDAAGPISAVNIDAAAGNDHLTILGTAGNDAVNLSAFAANASFSTGRTLTAANVETSIGNGQGGFDVGTLAGTAGIETLDAAPTSVTLYGAGFLQQLNGFSQTTTAGNGGADAATLRDSAGNDAFVASSTTASLSGSGFSNTANGFSTVTGVATGGGLDTATLIGTSGVDRFIGKAQIKLAQLSGTGYKLVTSGFDQVVANGGGGTSDIARFFDNQFNNQFIASKGDARLKQGATLLLRAQNFETVVGSAVAGGNDTATLNGTAQNDKFFGYSTQGTLQGPVSGSQLAYAFTQAGFDVTIANAGTGNDSAKLFGTSAANTLNGGPTVSRLFNGGMDVKANGFDTVEVNGRGGTDKAIFTDGGGSDTFNASPAQLFMDGSNFDIKATFFEIATANSTNGGNDKAILKGSIQKDTFTGGPTTASLTTVGLTATVNDFEIVEVDAVQGAQPDVATLTGSTGNDTFFGQGAIGRLSGLGGYSLQVDMFDTVTIKGLTGVNRLSGDLTSLSYMLNQFGTWTT